jgi:hypothetical protein
MGFPVHFSNGYRGRPLMGFTMQGWQTTFLGMHELPRDMSDFEMKAFFTFDGAQREAINARRGDAHKLGMALHIGFLRMSGRLLGACLT